MKKLQTVIKKLIVTFWSVIHSLRELLTLHMKMCWLVYSKIQQFSSIFNPVLFI